jgi:hypothetical protein
MSATPTRVQFASGLNTTFASSVSATFGSQNQPGNAILLAVEFDAGAANSGNTPTDTAGNKYFRLATARVAATFELEIWMATNILQKTGNVVTVTDTNAGVDSIVCVEEWSGVTSADLYSSATNTGSSTTLSTSNLATTGVPTLLWVAGVSAVGTSTMVLGSGYSNLGQNNTTFSNLGIESQVSSNGGSFTTGFTNTSASWACIAIALLGGFSNHTLSVGDGMSRSEVAN